jgi:hypothetical protein
MLGLVSEGLGTLALGFRMPSSLYATYYMASWSGHDIQKLLRSHWGIEMWGWGFAFGQMLFPCPCGRGLCTCSGYPDPNAGVELLG